MTRSSHPSRDGKGAAEARRDNCLTLQEAGPADLHLPAACFARGSDIRTNSPRLCVSPCRRTSSLALPASGEWTLLGLDAVYRARDTKLEREVAIKLCPMVSLYLVLELVEGQTLAQRLAGRSAGVETPRRGVSTSAQDNVNRAMTGRERRDIKSRGLPTKDQRERK